MLKHIFINQTGIITSSTFLPMRNLFTPVALKIHALGFDELLESILCILLAVEAFSCKKFF